MICSSLDLEDNHENLETREDYPFHNFLQSTANQCQKLIFLSPRPMVKINEKEVPLHDFFGYNFQNSAQPHRQRSSFT
jgi:hypothetical protein